MDSAWDRNSGDLKLVERPISIPVSDDKGAPMELTEAVGEIMGKPSTEPSSGDETKE